MRFIINIVVAQDENINEATSSYIDNVFVNENICPASRVKKHLQRFGLTCKDPREVKEQHMRVRIACQGGAQQASVESWK